MASQDSRIYDELLECLNDRLFQMPVKSFMDENCLIFDPCIEISPDHFAVYNSYQELVKGLLKDFCKSKQVSFDQLHDGIMKLYAEPDLREVFGTSFEQMLSAADFDIFNHTMIGHNIVIQEQVLQMILASTGAIPESLLDTRTIQSDDEKQRKAQDAMRKPPSQSKFARDEKGKKEKGSDLESKKEKEIEEQRKLIEEEMRLLVLESAKATKSSSQVQPIAKSTSKSSSAEAKPSSDLRSQAAVSSPSSPQMSSAEAAQKWMKDARQESGSHPDEGDARTGSRQNPETADMKQRQQFLREQRDKILALRREAREKQLGIDTEPRMKPKASKDSTKNPQPATTSPASASAENEKMLAKRRALAAKLRQEVVDKQ